LDGKLAPVLQRELERFATPWYQARSLRVFRDSSSLTANPGLWSSIEQALAASEWFVLMAAPEAARSRWVDREVSWWLANRSVRHLLIVVTDGELAWDEHIGDFDWTATNALPPALHGVFREEPRWVDLRWLREAQHVDRSNPRLRDCVADIAAAVREIPKDFLVGEHIRQHRRAMFLARSGATALAVFLICAVIAAVIAVGQRNTATNEGRIATARELAALAVANLGTHLDLAQLFAVQAYKMDQDPQTRAALFQSMTASPHLARYLPAGARVTSLVGSLDGNIVVAGTADGHVLRWDITRNTHETLLVDSTPITSVATDMDGTRILAADGAKALLWHTTTGRRQILQSSHSALVAVSPSGGRMAVLEKVADAGVPAGSHNELTTYDGDSGQQLIHTSLTSLWDKLGLPNDATVMLINGAGEWERRSMPTLAVVASSPMNELSPADAGTIGYSAEGDYYGYEVFGQVNGWHLATSASQSDANHPDLQTTSGTRQQVDPLTTVSPDGTSAVTAAAQTVSFTISTDGTRVATAAAQTVYVASTAADQQGGAPVQLTGNEGLTPDTLAFVGDQRVVSASNDKVVLWDLASPGRLGIDLGVQLNFGCVACEPHMASSPDGHRVVFVTVDQATEYQLNYPVNPQPLTGPGAPTGTLSPGEQGDEPVPVWSPDGTRLALLGVRNNSTLVWDPNNPARTIAGWPSTNFQTYPVTARVSSDGTRVAIVDSHGNVFVHRFSDGTTEQNVPGSADLNTIGFPPPNSAATISYDLATAALIDQHGVTLVDIHTGTHHILPGGPAHGVLYTQNELLILRPNGVLEVWDMAGTRLLRSIPGTPAYEPVFAAAPQGGLVAILRSDNVVVLTDLGTGVTLGSFPLPPAPTPNDQTVMAFTPDGTKLLVGAEGGRLTSWEMTDTAWVRAACARAGRELTAAEWTQNVGTTPTTSLSCMR
jgi:WD40 repeat protein